MEHLRITKQTLAFEIEQLSNPYLLELQSFIQYLKFKQANMAATSNDSRVLRPEDDPLIRAFGSIDAAPFSETIDTILYGAL